MKTTAVGNFWIGRLDDVALPAQGREKLMAMTNDEFAEELADMLEEAQAVANPVILFGVCGTESTEEGTVAVNGVTIRSSLAAEKLGGRSRCFPYVASCGRELEDWSKQYAGDLLAEFWADEIKKYYLGLVRAAYYTYIKEEYHLGGHLTSLNPGSLKAWPLSGQAELFDVLGGREFVEEQTGVVYTESFLMLPTKSSSGVAFESEVFYENCQFCPLENCPNRRAKRV